MQETFALVKSVQEAYESIANENLASLRYVPKDFATIQIRIFFDTSFQNLLEKISQVGFVFVHADGIECCNLF